MKRALLLALVVAAPLHAQVIGGENPDRRLPAGCVEVRENGAQSYDCLNRQLAQQAQQQQRFSSRDAPYDANSAGNVTGQFTESATRNRLGVNFGKSPFAPARPTYAQGLPHR